MLQDDALSAIKLLLQAGESLNQATARGDDISAQDQALHEAMQVTLQGIASALNANTQGLKSLEDKTKHVGRTSANTQELVQDTKAHISALITRQFHDLDTQLAKLERSETNPEDLEAQLTPLFARLGEQISEHISQSLPAQDSSEASPHEVYDELKQAIASLGEDFRKHPNSFHHLSNILLEKMEGQGRALAAALHTDMTSAVRHALETLREEHNLDLASAQAVEGRSEAGPMDEDQLKAQLDTALAPVLERLNDTPPAATLTDEALQAIGAQVDEHVKGHMETWLQRFAEQGSAAPQAAPPEDMLTSVRESLQSAVSALHDSLQDRLSTPVLDTSALSEEIGTKVSDTLNGQISELKSTLETALAKAEDGDEALADVLRAAAKEALDEAREHIRQTQLPELDELALMMRTELTNVSELTEGVDQRIQSLSEKLDKLSKALAETPEDDTSSQAQQALQTALDQIGQQLSEAEHSRQGLKDQIADINSETAPAPIIDLSSLDKRLEDIETALQALNATPEGGNAPGIDEQKLSDIIQDALHMPLRALSAKLDKADEDHGGTEQALANIESKQNDIFDALCEPSQDWSTQFDDLQTAVANLQDQLAQRASPEDLRQFWKEDVGCLQLQLEDMQEALKGQESTGLTQESLNNLLTQIHDIKSLGEALDLRFEEAQKNQTALLASSQDALLKNQSEFGILLNDIQARLPSEDLSDRLNTLEASLHSLGEQIREGGSDSPSSLDETLHDLKGQLHDISSLGEALDLRFEEAQKTQTEMLSRAQDNVVVQQKAILEQIEALKSHLTAPDQSDNSALLAALEEKFEALKPAEAALSAEKIHELQGHLSDIKTLGEALDLRFEQAQKTQALKLTQTQTALMANQDAVLTLLEKIEDKLGQDAPTETRGDSDMSGLVEALKTELKPLFNTESVSKALAGLEDRISHAIERADARQGGTQNALDINGTSLARTSVALKAMVQSFGQQTQGVQDDLEGMKRAIAETQHEIVKIKDALIETGKTQRKEAEADLVGLHHIVRDLSSAVQDIRKASEDFTPVSVMPRAPANSSSEVIDLVPAKTLDSERRSLNNAISALNAIAKKVETGLQAAPPLPQDYIDIIVSGVTERLSKMAPDNDLNEQMRQCIAALNQTHSQMAQPSSARDFSASLNQLAFEGRSLREAIESQLSEVREALTHAPKHLDADLAARIEKASEETKRQASEILAVAAALSRENDNKTAAA